MSSAIGTVQVQQTYTRSSPLNVAAGQVSLVGESTFTIQNLGSVPVWCRLNNDTAAASSNWTRALPGHHALFSIDGAADQVLSLDFYIPAQSYRFIPMHDTQAQVAQNMGRVEVTRHGN
jgi:L-arabinose isomerase